MTVASNLLNDITQNDIRCQRCGLPVGLNNSYSNVRQQYNYFNMGISGFSNKIESYFKLSPMERQINRNSDI